MVALVALLAVSVQSCSMLRPAGPARPAKPAYPALTRADEERALKSVEGCAPVECFSTAVKDMRDATNPQAAYKLTGLRLKFPGSPWAARSALILGLLAINPNDADRTNGIAGTANPEDLFTEALSLKAVEDYVLLYLGRAYLQNSKHKEAVEAYDRLLRRHPASTLRDKALFERAVALDKAGLKDDALKDFGDFTKEYPKSELAPEALLKIAELRLKSDEPRKAVPALQKIMTLYPVGAAATEAKKLLAKLKRRGIDLPGPGPRERFIRAKNLFKKARYKKTLLELEALLEAGDNDYEGTGAILMARAAIRLRRYGLAVSTLNEYLRASRRPEERLKALFLLAVAAVRSDNLALLTRVEKDLGRGFPEDVKRARVMLFKADYYEAHGDSERARRIYTRVMNGFTGEPGAYARWRLAWANYKAGGPWKLATANGLMSTFPENSTPERHRQRFLYWSARSLEKLDRTEEALRTYARVCKARVSYYCQMAAERQSLLGGSDDYIKKDTKRPQVPAPYQTKAGGKLRSDNRYRAAVELLRLGLDEEAAAELAILSKKYAGKRRALLSLTSLFYGAGDYYRGLMLYFNNLGVISDGGEPEWLERITFPLEVVDFIRRVKGPGSADEYLVAAIIREESTFNPRAISRAGAMGLMQIMPKTGEFIAMKTGEDPIDRNDLLKPELNVRFGSWYLGHLARRFNNNLVLTIAGYNAGPEAVERWVEDGPTDLDEFIEEIPYPETRAYAKRVIKSYTEYLKSGGLDPSKRFIRPIVQIDKARRAGGGHSVPGGGRVVAKGG